MIDEILIEELEEKCKEKFLDKGYKGFANHGQIKSIMAEIMLEILNDLQPTDSTECDMPIVGQSFKCKACKDRKVLTSGGIAILCHCQVTK